ncbi:hypothetical protein [Nannocystis pusilla]|uniref:Uncharacterized protein n=1 Tax=Nannocystis pusilla TaxID=889268 RepID=A0ABS7TM55_9BACT|nr:hypothetical protein [Nannocystis pusilla]MBZ5709298.1 hypothetical protein [Nannocystis pusilla]
MSPVTLSLVLAMAPSPESVCHTRDTAAGRVDPQERGRALAAAADACREEFEATPVDAFDRRSYLAFEAERIYRKAHEAGGADRPLCAAKHVLEAFAASLATLSAGERLRDREDVQEALKDIATLQTCEPEASPPAPAVDTDHAPAARSTEASPELVKPVPRPPSSEPVPAPRAAAASPARTRRPLRIAGWTTLGVGLSLSLGGVGALAHGAVLHERVEALNATYGSNGIPQDQAVDPEAGKRADRFAIGLLIAGPAVIIAGSTLLAVDAYRAKNGRRFALSPSILPAAGLRFRLEF